MLPFTFAGFEIQHIASSQTQLTITARALTPASICPSCHQVSTHIHSYYTRSPQDLPISGQRVQLVLRVGASAQESKSPTLSWIGGIFLVGLTLAWGAVRDGKAAFTLPDLGW